jgi:2-methylisocitrate lyase-like PEP mutase family enzyme
VVDTMQTRMELYDRIDYHSYEQRWMRCLHSRRTSKTTSTQN